MAGTCKESILFVYLFFIFATCESLNLRFIMFVQNETIISTTITSISVR